MAPFAGDADVLVSGRIFYDMIFAGVPRMPRGGEEVYAAELVTCPGGVANRAIACARLDLKTRLSAAFGADEQGDSCWAAMVREGVDLSLSRRYAGWRTPVTVSAALDDDRAMLTHALDPPESLSAAIADNPASRAAIAELDPLEQTPLTAEAWIPHAQARDTMVFVTTHFDSSRRWSKAVLAQLGGCHAVLPNEMEALRYTHTDTVEDAMAVLAKSVPLVVVTRGSRGAIARDDGTGESAEVPALPTAVRDTTGAGDVFTAAVIYGTLEGWPLTQRLAFANLCSSLAIRRAGSSVSAPTWAEIAAWWSGTSAAEAGAAGPADDETEIRRRYAFLDTLARPEFAGAADSPGAGQ